MGRKRREKEWTLLFQSREDHMRRFFLSWGRWGRVEVKSQVDFGKRRWGFDGASCGTHVSGVWRKRERRVTEAIAMAPNDSFLRNVSISFSIVLPDLLLLISLHFYSSNFDLSSLLFSSALSFLP